MTFFWPGFLLLLGLIPLAIFAYLLVLRKHRSHAVRYSSLSLLRSALPRTSPLRRHLPFALFLLAFASLIVAIGRPATIISVPTNQTTIILAIDVSGSMRSQDVQPSRLTAAEEAAIKFIQRQKSQTQIGIVAFSDYAELIQPPTVDQEALQTAVESLTTGRRTAIGSGILKSIDAIAMIDKNIPPSTTDPTSAPTTTPVPKGVYAPDIIILLTDGVSNVGPMPIIAAQQAVDRGIRVYTIGFGTQYGYIPYGGQQPQGNAPNGGGNFFGGGQSGLNQPYNGWFSSGIDEATLKQIAGMTGGKYYSAGSANELQNVFNKLPTYLILKNETNEISVLFTALGAGLAALALLLSLKWQPLP